MGAEIKKESVCVACGEIFTPYHRQSKYCPECKKLSNGTRDRMRMEREIALAEAKEAAARRTPKNPFDASCKGLKRIDAECRLFGMSYGQYTAACRSGTIEKLLKAKGFKNPRKMLKGIEIETWK